ncbi:carboxymuconolactone decarboxylase [Kibdelosporangium aridum]|uniref:Carboxymuconolactone decarboxylase n=1 Tax=Kibdelosporangium aridum TaxID=2030 RepID=A0A428ZND8_KIBAR|nr:carboxymuconolactone decarboxylase family protein [Kibdelosporangium aridum]RSM89574.1 carboxymuconolactone decarboxylase [Kibdelosporangium aridum]
MKDLHQKGRDVVGELIPDGKARLDKIFEVAPGLEELAVGVVYGHLHSRPALDARTREAAAISAIIASGGAGTPIRVHTRTGLSSGLAPAEITEIVTEAAAFSGFPRAVMALEHIKDVFTDAGAPVPPGPAPREVLLQAVESDERLAEFSGHPVQVVTTGPDTAIAIYADGTAIAWARISGSEIEELKVLR